MIEGIPSMRKCSATASWIAAASRAHDPAAKDAAENAGNPDRSREEAEHLCAAPSGEPIAQVYRLKCSHLSRQTPLAFRNG